MSNQQRAHLQHQFTDMEQQREASHIGMWIFLATEVLFFGGLFTGFGMLHHLYPDGFRMASEHTDFLLGSLNTAVLLVSSLFMALAVEAAKEGQSQRLLRCLAITMILGAAFLALKGLEYSEHIREGLLPAYHFHFDPRYAKPAELFFYLYFVMTGLHAVHMTGGMVTLAVLYWLGRRGTFTPSYYTPVQMSGLYWHFVDVIWIFLFPMFYLLGGR